jgi:serine/threonine protein phosphatase PrpC
MQGNLDPMTFNMMLNMMNVMHPNMGYNSNNYNYNMNNSADSMNLMMNWMNMNPLLLQMYNNNMFQNNNNNNYNQRISNVGRTKNNRGLPKKSPIPIQKGFMTGKYLNKSNISTISNYSNNTYNASCHSSDPYIINNISQISGYSNYSQYNQRNGPVLENNRIRPYSNNTRTLLSKNKKTNGSISYNRNNLKRNAKSSNNIRNKQNNNNNNSPNSFKAKTNNYINNNSINNMNKNKYVNKSPNIHDDYFLNNINGKLNNNYVNQIQNPNYYNMLNSNNSFSNLSSVSSVSNNLTNASYFTKMVQNNNISNQNMNLYNTKNHQNQNNKNNNINYINRQNMRPMTSDNYKGKSNNSKTAKKNNVNNDIINQNNPLFNLNPNEINYQNYNSNENKQKVNIMLNNLNKLGNFNNYMNGYNTYSHANKRQRSANLPVRKNNNYNNINPMVNLHIINKGQIINNNYNNINNMNNNMNNLYVYKYDVSQNNINQIKNNTNSKLNNSKRKKNIIRNNYFNGISDDEINMNMNNIKFNQMNNIINENQNNPRNLNPKERIRNNSSTGMGITGELNNLLNTRNNIRQRNMLPQKRINNNNNINNHIHQNLNHSQLSAQNRIQNPLKKTYIAKRIRKIHHFTHVGFNGEKDKDYNQDIAFLEKNFANNNTFLYMAVCDGHGVEGHQVSGFIKRTLPKDLSNALVNKEILTSDKNKKKKIYNIIGSTFIKVNEKLISNESINSIFSGTTCVSLIYTPIKLICANIGDSRAVLGRYDKKNKKWISINLSRDHKPTEEDEAKRILKKGGRIKPFIDEETGNEVGPLRVWVKDDEVPGLAMTRSFGDRVAAIAGTICVPEIKEYAFHEGDKFVIIASDGIWEFISSEECINIVGKFYENNDVMQCCEYLYNESRKRWIKEEEVVDDITMLLVFFD